MPDTPRARDEGESAPKPPQVPKPTVGLLVVNRDWDPARTPAEGWRLMTLKDAHAERAAFRAMDPDGEGKVILRAVTTYTLVEDGDRG